MSFAATISEVRCGLGRGVLKTSKKKGRDFDRIWRRCQTIRSFVSNREFRGRETIMDHTVDKDDVWASD